MEPSKQHELDKIGISAAWVAALGWASTGIFVRHFPDWPPLSIVAGRFMVAFIAVFLLIVFNGRKTQFANGFKQRLTWGLAALMVAYYLCATIAFQLAPVGEVALGISISPVFVLLFHLLTGRKTPRIEKVGSAISLVGVLLVFLPSVTEQSNFQHHFIGCALALSAGLIMASYSLAYQYRSPKHLAPESSVVALLTFALGLCILLSYLTMTQQLPVFKQLQQPSPLMLMIGLGLFATILPTLGYSIASQRLSPMLATSIRLATPIIAAALAMIFLQEVPSLWFWFGGCLVVSGLLVMTVRKSP